MKIPIVGLAQGIHEFDFVEEVSSCGLADHPNLNRPIEIKVYLEKRSTSLYLRNRVRTVGRFPCDRCLAEFDLAFGDEGRIVFTSDPDLLAYSNDEVHTLEKDAREINLTDDVRDLLLLSVPAKLLCAEDCKGLCPGCGVNLNSEECHCAPRPVDSRWQGLQKLMK